jgi:multidrug efflux system membrane fusion protein
MQHDTPNEPNQPDPRMRSRLMRAGVIAGVIAAIVVVVGLVARYQKAREVNQWTQTQAVPSVNVITARQGSTTSTLVLPGNLQPYIDAPILARVNGYLKVWYHDIGAHVKTGELLALIETPELDQQLDQAKADLASAIANENLAEVTAKRWANLLATDSVSKQDADEKMSNYVARKAATDAARANVGRIEALESFKRVVAPFDGIITARKTDVGALISAGTGTELFNVASIDPLRLFVPVPQNYSQRIKVGMKATLTVPEYPGREFDATLVRTSGSIRGASGTLLVELEVANKTGTLTPGGYAEVKFILPEDAAIRRVPASALILRHGVELAVVQSDNRIKLKKVVLGRDFGSEVEIQSGLEPGDRIVDSPYDSIEDGDQVKVNTPEPAAAGSAGSAAAGKKP